MTTYVELENACKNVYLNAGMEGIDTNSLLGNMLENVKGFFSTIIAGGREHIIEVDQRAATQVYKTFTYGDLMNRNAYMPRGLKGNFKEVLDLCLAGRKYMGIVEKTIVPENVNWLASVLAGNHTTSNAPMPKDGYRINIEKEIAVVLGGKDVEMKPFNELFSNLTDFVTAGKTICDIFDNVTRNDIIKLNKDTQRMADIATRLIDGTKSGEIQLNQVMLRTLASCIMSVAAHTEMYSGITSIGILTAESLNNTANLFIKQGKA